MPKVSTGKTSELDDSRKKKKNPSTSSGVDGPTVTITKQSSHIIKHRNDSSETDRTPSPKKRNGNTSTLRKPKSDPIYYDPDTTVGVDEAGRGCCFSRVYVATVIIGSEFKNPPPKGIVLRDSKKMTAPQRKLAAEYIKQNVLEWRISWRDEDVIDKINVTGAEMQAIHQCLDELCEPFDFIIMDGNYFLPYHRKKRIVRDGDDIDMNSSSIHGDDNHHQLTTDENITKSLASVTAEKSQTTIENAGGAITRMEEDENTCTNQPKGVKDGTASTTVNNKNTQSLTADSDQETEKEVIQDGEEEALLEEEEEEDEDEFEQVRHLCVAKADDDYLPVSCASILAKEARDSYVKQLCEEYPELQKRYNLMSNMGYQRPEHKSGIEKYGISQFHRRSYSTCKGAQVCPVIR